MHGLSHSLPLASAAAQAQGQNVPVAVIGGGIAGLAAAWRLAQAGRQVVLLEASAQCGGLGRTFDWQGQSIERFYHCLLPSDSQLLPLLQELGLASEVYWRTTGFAYLTQGKVYPLNGAKDLLAFAPLGLLDRLRVGLAGLHARRCSSQGLDDLSCEQWLSGLAGPRAYERFFKPMLKAKFGAGHSRVPALWFWSRLNREKGQGPERKGYLPGGYRRIAQTLLAALERAGVKVLTHTAVSSIDLSNEQTLGLRWQSPSGQNQTLKVAQALYTAPLPLLPPLLQGPGSEAALGALGGLADMQGVVNSVWALSRSLSPHYWVAAMDEGLPFQGLVQTSNLIGHDGSAPAHLVYLTRYVHRSSAPYAQSDEAVLEADFTALRAQFVDLLPSQVLGRWVFRSPYVEPLYSAGYASRLPPSELVRGRLFLATTSQAYPQVTSWNAAVGVAQQAVSKMLAGQRPHPAWVSASAGQRPTEQVQP